jgi:hypothetical protein
LNHNQQQRALDGVFWWQAFPSSHSLANVLPVISFIRLKIDKCTFSSPGNITSQLQQRTSRNTGLVYSRLPSITHSHPFSFSAFAFASKAEKYPAHVVPLFSCGMNSSNRPIAQSSISSICKHLRPQNANGRKSRPRLYLSPLPRLQRNPSIPRKKHIRNPDVEYRNPDRGPYPPGLG